MTRCSLWLWTPQAGHNQVPQSSLTPQYRGQERGGGGEFGQGWALAKEVLIPVAGYDGYSRKTDAKEYPKLYFNLQIKSKYRHLEGAPLKVCYPVSSPSCIPFSYTTQYQSLAATLGEGGLAVPATPLAGWGWELPVLATPLAGGVTGSAWLHP